MQSFIISKRAKKRAKNLTQRRRDAEAQSFFVKYFFASWRLCVLALILIFPVLSQKLAVLTPEKNGQSESFAEKLETSLSGKYKVLNSSLSEAAFLSANPETPFNMTTEEAGIIGAAIGCDFFLLVKSVDQRRYSSEKKEYFESYAAVYAISARTGKLVFWKLQNFEDADAGKARKMLFDSTGELAKEIFDGLSLVSREALNERTVKIEQMPAENSPAAKNFRSPLPYKRLSPAYTALANLHKITATVDIEVDFDENGTIQRTNIVRWAGFGLDESVTETVRKMNWRPAMRDGKPLAMRILLRYNFKKIDKED